jgi:hypothetical protein
MPGITSIEIYEDRVIADAWTGSTDQRAEIAQQAAGIARASAPVLTGRYKGGIGAEVAGDEVAVVDSDPVSRYKELGTSDTPAHAAVIQAASQFGRYDGLQPRGTAARSRRNAGAR